MPAQNPRITTVVNREVATWLRRKSKSEGTSVSTLVREILARQLAEEEERYWAAEGEERLGSFDPETAVSHRDAWR